VSRSNTLPEVGFVREPVVLAHVGFGRTKWRSLVADEMAPQPRRLGPRCTMYDASEIRAWIAERSRSAPLVKIKSANVSKAVDAVAVAA
jgi:prophage regulatory protein